MATNNNGNLIDSSGSVAVDFVWGPLPMQPNDDRAASVSQIGGGAGDASWSPTTKVASDRLNPALSNHAIVEADYAGFPAFVAATGNYIVTAASGNGTTVTYTSQNKLAVGDVVNITGLSTSAFNLSSATVASADVTKFTVTNGAGSGVTITGQYGKVESTTAQASGDGAYIAGVAYIHVPNVLGQTTASALDALKDSGYEAANITTASGATNTAATITAVARTNSTATITSAGAGAAFPVGTSITVASLVSPNTDLNGTWIVTGSATNTLTFTTTTSGTLSTTGLSVAGLTGTSGTIKAQSTAADTASVSTTATITITPWA